jgi:hypothetical protein
VPQLLDHIIKTTKSDFDTEDKEIPFPYLSRDIDLAVWSQVLPASDEHSSQIPDTDNGKYFRTIGIGIKGYYQER